MSRRFIETGVVFENFKRDLIHISELFISSRFDMIVCYSFECDGKKKNFLESTKEFRKTLNKHKMFRQDDINNLAKGSL